MIGNQTGSEIITGKYVFISLLSPKSISFMQKKTGNIKLNSLSPRQAGAAVTIIAKIIMIN